MRILIFYLMVSVLAIHVPIFATSLPQKFFIKLKEQQRPLTSQVLIVSIDDQKMYLYDNKALKATYCISTAKNGTGQKQDSYQTPLGLHLITQKIGHLAPLYTIFCKRKVTGQMWTPSSPDKWRNSDLVLTRILWLEGMEQGYNLGKTADGESVDSMSRYIYIHGTNHEDLLGIPASKGCIRMKNSDIVELYDRVEIGSLVYITKGTDL